MNKNILRNLSYGVYVVSTLDGERPTGCIANSAMQITSEPATIAVSINHDNYTNKCIKSSGKIGISILSEKSDPKIIGTFGFQSGKDVNKFDTVAYEMKEGVPVVKDSCGYIVLKLVNSFETSTHTIFIGEMVDGDIFHSDCEMTYAYYHKVVKGSSPAKAPTYLPPEETKTAPAKKVVWQCQICKYIYDGKIPFEDLPADWKCPICGKPKSFFKKVEI